MKIVVCVKYVPDAQGDRRFTESDHTVDRAGTDGILSELDEYAVEEALKLAEAQGDSTVTVLTAGPDGATDALRKALQMGADDAVHVVDDALHGSDALATSLVLAKALQKLEFDLVLTGMASTDGGMSVVPAMLAERLGVPQVTFAGSVTVDGGVVRIERDSDTSTEVV
jgi:electron transfer flavoprotein beta subunit